MIKTNPVLFYAIICGTVMFIIALNISLFSWVKQNSLHRQIKMTKNMVRKVQSPWEDEDKDLTELSQLVKTLQHDNNNDDQK